jgi:putative FmdB family regulatory protein
MPIYEYQCGKCGHCFEQIHGVSDKGPKAVCPRCGHPKTERVMSTFSCGGGSKGIESGASAGGCGSGGGRFT